MTKEELLKLSDDLEMLQVARQAIQDVLIDFRDRRISVLGLGSGMVIKEKDGTPSDLIRLTSIEVIRIGLKAMAEKLGESKCRIVIS